MLLVAVGGLLAPTELTLSVCSALRPALSVTTKRKTKRSACAGKVTLASACVALRSVTAGPLTCVHA